MATASKEVGVRWTATGTGSELQMATGKTPAALGAFGAPPVGTQLPDGATSTTVALKMGSVTGTAYQFRVRSCTGTACGAWTTGPAFTLGRADETGFAAAASKGDWTTDTTVTGAYDGTVRWSAGSAVATIVDRIQFTVSGNAAPATSRSMRLKRGSRRESASGRLTARARGRGDRPWALRRASASPAQ
jgi:hypothetical protein